MFCLGQDEMRLEVTSQIAGTVTRLLMSGLVARENSGKIREIFGMGRDYSVPLGKFLNGLEMN